MSPLAYSVLQHLAAGEFQSGARLACALAVSRASIWNAVRELERAGLEIYCVRGRGYRLEQPLALIDGGKVMCALRPHSRFIVEVVKSSPSTNTLALERARLNAPSGTVIAAEWQTAGRGRLGRIWHAPIAGGLTFSLIWRSRQSAAFLSGLSLAVGVAIVRALQGQGVRHAQLKWPNDVVWRDRKLAGILIEMHGDAWGPTCAVIGVGVNVRLPPSAHQFIDQPAVDLDTASGRAIDRNDLLAALLIDMESMLQGFERQGFAPLRGEWQRLHAWQDREVAIRLPDGRIEAGMARGVDRDGALLVATQGAVQRYHSGEVSLRLKSRARTRARAAS